MKGLYLQRPLGIPFYGGLNGAVEVASNVQLTVSKGPRSMGRVEKATHFIFRATGVEKELGGLYIHSSRTVKGVLQIRSGRRERSPLCVELEQSKEG